MASLHPSTTFQPAGIWVTPWREPRDPFRAGEPRQELCSTRAPVAGGGKVGQRVLIVEDDPSIKEIEALGLERAGFEAAAEEDGQQALLRFRREHFDAVVLDLMVPSLDGFHLCRELRDESGVPILIVTAKDDTMEIVAGLELGADDYLTKPFEMPELIARLRALLRRTQSIYPQSILQIGDLEIDPDGFTVRKAETDLHLSTTEFRLLLTLAQRPGQVFTREVLVDQVWGYEYFGDSRLVDMAIKRLRDKVEDEPGAPKLIVTVRGVGYRLQVD